MQQLWHGLCARDCLFCVPTAAVVHARGAGVRYREQRAGCVGCSGRADGSADFRLLAPPPTVPLMEGRGDNTRPRGGSASRRLAVAGERGSEGGGGGGGG
jgi:hypothetical protein